MTQRLSINLDEDTAAIIDKLTAHTGLNASDIIIRLVEGLLPELHEVNALLDAYLPAGAGSLHEQAANLIQSYGPESIMDGIARIAPQWETLAARFDREMNEVIGPAPTLL
jgi:ribonuclease HIII